MPDLKLAAIFSMNERFFWLLVVSLTVCSCDSSKLSQGYEIKRTSGGSCYIGKRDDNSMVVAQDITKIADLGVAILGFSSPYNLNDDESAVSSRGGYFSLDTRNGKVIKEMSFEEFKDYSKSELKLKNLPTLREVPGR